MVNSLKQEKELEHLRQQHDDVEAMISALMRNKVIDQFKIQDLKKKKLMLKEAISQLENALFADDSVA